MDEDEIEGTENTDVDINISVSENEIEELESPQKQPTGPNNQKRLLRLPLARVKNMMKLDPECSVISQDSVFLVTKATEMFIEYLAVEAVKNVGHGKRKTILKRDVESAIDNNPNMCFLDGAME